MKCNEREQGKRDGLICFGLRRRGALRRQRQRNVISLRHFPETAHVQWTPSLKQRGIHDGHHSHART